MVVRKENYPNLHGVITEIAKQSPFQKKAIFNYIESADQRYLNFSENLIKRVLHVIDKGSCFDYIAKTYLWYTKRIRIEEMYFSKQGAYRYSQYDDVYSKVYGQNDYMFDYVIGLGMTQIFWPNHWEIMKFYMDYFIPIVKNYTTGAEIGVGHGIFHAEFLKECSEMKSLIIDVSPVSIQTTKKMIAATGIDISRIKAIQIDVQKEIPIDDGILDALLMGELIEHIQNGETVMSALAKKMTNSGFCYFSTAANSPAEDHILLFKTTDEIRDFIEKTGWEIVVEHLGTLKNMSVAESEKRGKNINYAAVLKPQ